LLKRLLLLEFEGGRIEVLDKNSLRHLLTIKLHGGHKLLSSPRSDDFLVKEENSLRVFKL